MFQHEERIQPDRYYQQHYSTYVNYLGRYGFAGKFVGPYATVLDLACGCGYGAAYLTEAPGRTVLALDRDADALTYARRQYRGVPAFLIRGGSTALPVKGESLDAVVALEMIEHVSDDQAVVKEVARVLKRDGVFVVSTPNRYVTSPSGKPENPYHVREYAPGEFVSLLQLGFHRVALYGETLSEASRVRRENLARIWRNLSLLHAQVFALRGRLQMNERYTGLSMLRRLKRALFGASSEPSPFAGAFVHGVDPVNRLGDWDITPYNIETAPVMIAVCRK